MNSFTSTTVRALLLAAAGCSSDPTSVSRTTHGDMDGGGEAGADAPAPSTGATSTAVPDAGDLVTEASTDAGGANEGAPPSGEDASGPSVDGGDSTDGASPNAPLAHSGETDPTEPQDAEVAVAVEIRPGPYQAVDVSNGPVACGLTLDGDAHCWGPFAPPLSTGTDRSGEVLVDGPFTRIEAADNFACALRVDGTMQCWFADGDFLAVDELPDLPGQLTEFSVGGDLPCAIDGAGELFCNDDGYSGNPMSGRFEQLSGGDLQCVLDADGAVECWRWALQVDSTWQVEESTTPDGVFTQVSAGYPQVCALSEGSSLVCWGGQADPPPGSFEQVSIGVGYGCAVEAGGTVRCWGNDDEGQASPPRGRFRQVAAGGSSTCALNDDDEAVCWGASLAAQRQ